MRVCKLNPRCIDYELASHKKNNHEILFCLILILDDNCMFHRKGDGQEPLYQ